MKQIITKQGKSFDYRDILLFNVVNDNIIVILNDKEQLNKFISTGNSNDAPISVIPYSEEEFTNLVFYMKRIINYTELDSKDIRVEY